MALVALEHEETWWRWGKLDLEWRRQVCRLPLEAEQLLLDLEWRRQVCRLPVEPEVEMEA